MTRIGFLLLLFATPILADDFDKAKLHNWHQWRGPNADGVSPDGNPPLEWGPKKNIVWKSKIPGVGSSTPIIWQDQVFVLSSLDTEREADPADIPKPDPVLGDKKKTRAPKTYHQYLVLSYDRKTGKERWRAVAREAVPHEGHHSSHTFAAFSPTTDGKHLFVNFGSQGVYCYTLDGKLVWKRRDLGRLETRYGWGEAVSPVWHGDVLIVNGDHEGASWLVVLDKSTGKTKWRAERDEPTSWATPLVVEHKGTTQLIVHGTNRVRSYDLKTGKVLWQCGGHSVNAIPSPVVKDGVLYILSGYRKYLAQAIPLDVRGDITDTDKILWQHKTGTPYVPSGVIVDNRLYCTMSNIAALSVLDIATGKPLVDRTRITGLRNLYASPVVAKGRVYFTGRDGTTTVISSTKEPEVLAVNRLDDPIDASPAIVGDKIFLRSADYLYCIGKTE